MCKIANAVECGSVSKFKASMDELQKKAEDGGSSSSSNQSFIMRQLNRVMDDMIDQNLLTTLAPYSRVQLDFVADKAKLPVDVVEKSISRLILEQRVAGVLDQESKTVILFGKEEQTCEVLDGFISLLQDMSVVVDKLYAKAKDLP